MQTRLKAAERLLVALAAIVTVIVGALQLADRFL